jgi:hypothetical protein
LWGPGLAGDVSKDQHVNKPLDPRQRAYDLARFQTLSTLWLRENPHTPRYQQFTAELQALGKTYAQDETFRSVIKHQDDMRRTYHAVMALEPEKTPDKHKDLTPPRGFER